VEKGAGREETTTDCGLRSKNLLGSAAVLFGNGKSICGLGAQPQPTEQNLKKRTFFGRIFIN